MRNTGRGPCNGDSSLPARRIDITGHAQVDFRSVFALAAPLMASSALQILLSLTDTWFIGRLSTQALAAVSAVHWPIVVVILLLGCISMAVQTLVAQSFGARCYARGSKAVWIALWGTLSVAPLFFVVGFGGKWFLQVVGLDPQLQELGAQFWLPRMIGAPFGVAAAAILGFFNGIGRPKVAAMVILFMTIVNAALNQVFIFGFHLGIAGSAWASAVAQVLGLAGAVAVFLGRDYRDRYRSHLTWKVYPSKVIRQSVLGFAMSLPVVADLLALALFQIMQARVGAVAGAVTQITMMLTSIAYMPGAGLASAGAILVGQSVGGGDRDWAMRVGTRVIALAAVYMGGIGLLLALSGPWLVPKFVSANDPQASLVIASGVQILWFAAIYQFFDGLYMGSCFCLRGAGDTTIPAGLVLILGWLVFVPLVHTLTFSPGQGWISDMPQFGWGLTGGWSAMVFYVTLLGTALLVRWRSGAWKHKSDLRLQRVKKY